MSITIGTPKTTTDNLLFYLDANNPRCYISGSSVCDNIIDKSTEKVNTLTNGTSFNGSSFVFDGNNDYINLDLSNLTTTSNTYPYSVEILFKSDDISSNDRLFSKVNSIASNDALSIGILSGGLPKLKLYDGNSEITTTNTIIANNVWYHHIITFNTTGTTVTSYLNGEFELNTTVQPTAYINFSDMSLAAPYDLQFGGFWDGEISIFKIYNKELSQSDVTQNYNAIKSRM